MKRKLPRIRPRPSKEVFLTTTFHSLKKKYKLKEEQQKMLTEVAYSLPVIIVLIASIVAKYALAFYLKKRGREIKSNVLIASGAETMNDAWISCAERASLPLHLKG